MKTTPGPHDVERLPADLTADVVAFFDTLRKAQVGFLGTVGQAQSLLGGESGQLAHVVAIQGRLTRQFFDAQRSIMMHRAEVDVAVAHIGATAENTSTAMVAARVQAVGGVPAVRATPWSDARADIDVVHRSAREEIASLGAFVVRTMADADSLARVIDEAFEPDEPDGAMAERQLRALLDEWWNVEKQESRDVIDDADARAAMRRHIERIEAGEDLEAARSPGDPSEPGVGYGERLRVLPPEIVAALATADPADLHDLLATLADSLAPAPTVATPPAIRLACDVIIKFDPVPAAPRGTEVASEVAPEEAFRRFWDKASAPAASRRHWRRIPPRVVLPMTAVTSGLALFVALIG